MSSQIETERHCEFRMTLGRTSNILGFNYKRRDAAIAELVANCWDAGATNVEIKLPEASELRPPIQRNQITATRGGNDRRLK